MKQVIFIYNELLDEEKQKLARLPLEFICFAYIKGAIMYEIKGKYYAIEENKLRKTNQYNKVYGAMYILHSSEHFMRTLDAIMTCSKSFTGANHKYDIMHRLNVKARPIHFKDIEEFVKMKYNETEEVNVITYLANPQNDFIKTNVLNTVNNREVSGLDINHFIDLILARCEDET